jgi:hypothetical protein
MAPPRQQRQVLANADARRVRLDRPELAAHVLRRLRLQIEALVLRQPAGEEDVDDRPRRPRRALPRLGAKGGEVVHPQPEQPYSPGLYGRASGELWVLEEQGHCGAQAEAIAFDAEVGP